jgi:Fic family protein
VLYISPALESDKDTYIDLMYNVSSKGEWAPWVQFFFHAVCKACNDAVSTIDRLLNLQDNYREKARTSQRSGSAAALVDLLFEQPAINVGDAQQKLGVSYPTAKSAIDKLVELKILVEVPGFYPKTYIATGIMHVSAPQDEARETV